jgi:hypothetical protein
LYDAVCTVFETKTCLDKLFLRIDMTVGSMIVGCRIAFTGVHCFLRIAVYRLIPVLCLLTQCSDCLFLTLLQVWIAGLQQEYSKDKE